MKNLLTVLAFFGVLIFASPMYAQITFERWYGGTEYDQASSACQTTDGGYIIVGETESFGNGVDVVYLVKTDSLGDTVWTNCYGGILSDIGTSVMQTSDGGYIISGWTASFARYWEKVYLARTDSLGDTMWTRHFGGDVMNARGFSVSQTLDSGFIVVGWHTDSFGINGCDAYLIKTDQLGDTIWTKKYGGSIWEEGFSVKQTLDGGYAIAGRTSSFGAGGMDVYLIKTDTNGDTLWTRAYGGIGNDKAFSIAQTTDGGYIIAGWTNSFGSGNADVYLVKTDSIGDTLWTKTYGGTEYDRGFSVCQTTDGGYAIAGETNSFGADLYDVYIIRTDSFGDSLWTCLYGGSSADAGRSIDQTSDGGFVIAGFTVSYGAGLTDVYLIKTDSLGNLGIEEEKKDLKSPKPDAKLIYHPNPFTTFTNCHLREIKAGEVFVLEIVDASGRLVKTVSLTMKTSKFGIDLSAGVYFIKLDGIPVGKVVKIR